MKAVSHGNRSGQKIRGGGQNMARGDQILQPDLVHEDSHMAAISCPHGPNLAGPNMA